MDQQPNIQPDLQAEGASQSREEMVQDFVAEIGHLMDMEAPDQALGRFRQLHPVDQGEALADFSPEIRLFLLESLDPGENRRYS